MDFCHRRCSLGAIENDSVVPIATKNQSNSFFSEEGIWLYWGIIKIGGGVYVDITANPSVSTNGLRISERVCSTIFFSLSLYNPLSDGVTLSSSIRGQLKLLGNLLPSLVIAAEKAYSAFWLGDGKRREEGVGRRVINAAGPVQYSLCFLFVLCPEPGHIKSVGGCVRQKKTGG